MMLQNRMEIVEKGRLWIRSRERSDLALRRGRRDGALLQGRRTFHGGVQGWASRGAEARSAVAEFGVLRVRGISRDCRGGGLAQ